MEPIELDSGLIVTTGLKMPSSKPKAFLSYGDVGKMLTKDQALQVIHSPTYKGGRKRFGKKFHRVQLNNSCNAQAAVGALERARAEKGLTHVRLSAPTLYCEISGDADDGSHLHHGMAALITTGTSTYATFGDETAYRRSDVPAAAWKECPRFRALECLRIEDEDMWVSSLACDYFCVVAVHVGRNRNYGVDAEGIITPSDGPGDHAVLNDGLVYFDNMFFGDVDNSWPLSWGDEGRGLVSWQYHFRGTSRNHAFYAIRGVIDDPLNPLPPAH